MAAKQLIIAGMIFATAPLAHAIPMGAAAGPDHLLAGGTVTSAPAQLRFEGGAFDNGPADTSALGNGGVTGGPSAPPPFSNIANGKPVADAAPPGQIPEPASAALLLAGLVGLTVAGRRRRK